MKLNGADFVAVNRLSTRANVTLADVGETCERVPESALLHHYQQGDIVAAVRDDKPSPVAERVRARKAK